MSEHMTPFTGAEREPIAASLRERGMTDDGEVWAWTTNIRTSLAVDMPRAWLGKRGAPYGPFTIAEALLSGSPWLNPPNGWRDWRIRLAVADAIAQCIIRHREASAD